jgi:ferritin-like metal-binding protein YciE
MIIDSPMAIYLDQLQDILSVETQLETAMPELIAMASQPELAELLDNHLIETARHRDRVAEILRRHGSGEGQDPCKAMEGLLEGGSNHLAKTRGSAIRDLLLVAHCSRIETYEIAAYEFTLTMAEHLGLREECEVLRENLGDEKRMLAGLEKFRNVGSVFG